MTASRLQGLNQLAWTVMTLSLGAGALGVALVTLLDGKIAARLDWQPEMARTELWRYWSAACVHWDVWHLAANLIGCAAIWAWGRACRLGLGPTLAWLLAWPLTHAGLWLDPGLQRYAGLSGLLHSGVAIGAMHLVIHQAGKQRQLGLLMLLGLALKLASEAAALSGPMDMQKLGLPLPGASGFVVSVYAHGVGSLAGAFCLAMLALIQGHWQARRPLDRTRVLCP